MNSTLHLALADDQFIPFYARSGIIFIIYKIYYQHSEQLNILFSQSQNLTPYVPLSTRASLRIQYDFSTLFVSLLKTRNTFDP